jgi:SAM-dependent methyltransferase
VNRWDQRYQSDRYFYGTEPNVHVARSLAQLPPGRGLFLAEGEGRNVVYAAGLGHDAVAVDSSGEGRRKALQLAEEKGVVIDYIQADAAVYPWDAERWDFIVLCFYHMIPAERGAFHARVAAALRPGGTLILQSFSKAQLGRPSGGPPDGERLFELAVLRRDFPGVSWEVAREREVELAEGVGHRGLAAVIEMVGKRDDAHVDDGDIG